MCDAPSGSAVLVNFTRIMCGEVMIECVPATPDTNHHVTSLQQLQMENVIFREHSLFGIFRTLLSITEHLVVIHYI